MADQSANPSGNPNTALLQQVVSGELDRRGYGDGGGGGGPTGTDARIAKLEASAQHMQSDLTEIRTVLSGLSHTLHQLPSRQDLTNNLLAVVAIGLTVIVLAIGGIIAGMSWLQTRDAAPPAQQAPAPLIFQLPPQSQPVPVAPTPVPSAPAPKKSGGH